jgi:hypothetical protein
VPLVLWALLNRRAFDVVVGEPLLQHFGIHVRFLVAVPLLWPPSPSRKRSGAASSRAFSLPDWCGSKRARPSQKYWERPRRLLTSRLVLVAIPSWRSPSAAPPWGTSS